MKGSQKGFTLMEMIGVVAVIAILASMATPMIFDAIRNARISAFVEDVNVVRTATARFYEDTGAFPVHVPTDARDGYQQLMKNRTANPISGWDGPYIEKDLENPFNGTAYRAVLNTTAAQYQFDLDGDGTMDTSRVSVIRMDRVSDTDAQKISDILDGDGDVSTGNEDWRRAGRVKRFNGDHASILLIYLSRS